MPPTLLSLWAAPRLLPPYASDATVLTATWQRQLGVAGEAVTEARALRVRELSSHTPSRTLLGDSFRDVTVLPPKVLT